MNHNKKCWRRVLNQAGSVKSACVRHDLGLAESGKDLFLGALQSYQAVYQFSLAIRPTMAIITCFLESAAGGKLTSGGTEKQ